MFKFFAICLFAIIACVAAKPAVLAYSSPYTAAYTAGYASPYAAYTAYPYASAYSAYSAYPAYASSAYSAYPYATLLR